MDSMTEEERTEMMQLMMPIMMKDMKPEMMADMMKQMTPEMKKDCTKMMTQCLKLMQETQQTHEQKK